MLTKLTKITNGRSSISWANPQIERVVASLVVPVVPVAERCELVQVEHVTR